MAKRSSPKVPAARLRKPAPHTETLERVKRWPKLLSKFDLVRIYSGEHTAYWRPEGGGYTTDPDGAWVTTFQQAFDRTRHAGPEKMISFSEVVMTTCPQCDGKGSIWIRCEGPLAEFSSRICMVCDGAGKAEREDDKPSI